MFDTLTTLPADPILGLMGAFRADDRPFKVDLGVGVYKDEQGATPILSSVKMAAERLLDTQESKAYVGPAGNPLFLDLLTRLVLGDCQSEAVSDRVACIQTPGGCGALRVLAELIKVAKPTATIWVSDPTWANHIPLLGTCGIQIQTYPYLDPQTGGVDFESMLACLQQVGEGDLVLVHGSCHNPSGADLTFAQWQTLTTLATEKGFVPFVDLAYQGFGEGIESDVQGLRWMAKHLPEVAIAVSCSKNFGLYRERVGMAMVLCPNSASARAATSQMLSIVRGIYSMPPDYGAALVAIVLNDTELKEQWQEDVGHMRRRINGLRSHFSQQMRELTQSQQFDFVEQQKGMFSFLGLTVAEVAALREKHAIYMLDSSRTSIAGMNDANLRYICQAVSETFMAR